MTIECAAARIGQTTLIAKAPTTQFDFDALIGGSNVWRWRNANRRDLAVHSVDHGHALAN